MVVTFIICVVVSCVLALFITPKFENDPKGRAEFIEHM